MRDDKDIWTNINQEQLRPSTPDANVAWICDQIRNLCGDQCAEEILTLTCSLESSVDEYCDQAADGFTPLGAILKAYLADNPEWNAYAERNHIVL